MLFSVVTLQMSSYQATHYASLYTVIVLIRKGLTFSSSGEEKLTRLQPFISLRCYPII